VSADHEHRVCTYREAEAAVKAHEAVYVNDCFCRGPAKEGKAKWAYCGHPVRTCMGFHEPKEAKYEVEKINQARALEMMADWKKNALPFRFMMNEEWICFCCACGCGWFRDDSGNRQQDPCKKSRFIEQTNRETCDDCGACVKTCAWDARSLRSGRLAVDQTKCYGCSVCEHVCPTDAVTMVPRGEQN